MVIVLLCNFIRCPKNNEKKERIFSSQLQRFVSRNVKGSQQRTVTSSQPGCKTKWRRQDRTEKGIAPNKAHTRDSVHTH